MTDQKSIELTVLMPCLDEAETLEVCIKKALDFFTRYDVVGEVLISDNGSTDGSIEIAERCGARVVHAPLKGYGAALSHGINNAYGDYVIMGDSDDSYDFSKLELYVDELRKGTDLVMGNRFKGGIAKGAMPFIHKYLGNPVLSFIGRLFFKIKAKDFHCGLRGFNRQRMVDLNLHTTGMEFASEMVVRSSLAGFSIAEVPTTLAVDGRTRPPHLRTWRDGWRHLRFLLMFSPKWLFFYPALLCFVFGGVLTTLLLPGAVAVSPTVTLDVHTMVIASLAMLIGAQSLSFAIVARRYATLRGLLPADKNFNRITSFFSLEKVLLFTALLLLGGLGGIGYCVSIWWSAGFGALEYASLTRIITVSSTAVVLGLQLAFTGFFAAMLDIKFNE
jgi:glycosyltransferase involved in cell wall biosynthesis